MKEVLIVFTVNVIATYSCLQKKVFFHTLVLQEYLVLTESRIPLKPVLWGVRIVALYICSHEQTQ